MNCNYKQEQKDKYASHILKCAEDLSKCSDSELQTSHINNLIAFLLGCGYSEPFILTHKDSIVHFHKKGDLQNLVNSLKMLADSIMVMDLPHKPMQNAPININNSNSQKTDFNISVIDNALSNELSTEQIAKLKELIKTKKRGDVKSWLSELGNSTLSGLLSSILTSLSGL